MTRLVMVTVAATVVALLAPTGAVARQADTVRLDGVRVELRAGAARVPVIAVAR